MNIEEHRIDVCEGNMPDFVAAVVQKTLDGYEVDPAMPGDTNYFGNVFSVSMFRNADTVERMRSTIANIAEKPKLSRAEILANAREAKKAKAAAVLDVNTVQD